MTLSMSKKIVVFDLDDTLYKEVDFLKSAYRHIASLISRADIPAAEVYNLLWTTYLQKGRPFQTVANKYGFKFFDADWMLRTYRSHVPNISVDDDTKRTLGELRKRGVVLGVISDGRRESQMNKIKSLGLERWIDSSNIIINDQETRFKPDMRSFRDFEAKYGKDAEYWYVGDNTSKDFVAPNVLGWTTVCLKDDGRNIHKQNLMLESPVMPNIIIGKLSELL